MHTSASTTSNTSLHCNTRAPDKAPALTLVSQLAKQLHRAARADELAICLPVLRRLLASQVLVNISLAQLQRRRSLVQRKHLLQLLAREAGAASWEAYRAQLVTMSPEQLGHFDLLKRELGYPNLWFADLASAQAYVREHGGRALAVGNQAVVLVAQH